MALKKTITYLKNSFTHSTKSGDNNNQTPRDRFIKKEKELKIKFYVILFLSHSLWPLATTSSKSIAKPKIVKEGNILIKVPVNNYVYLSGNETKTKVYLRQRRENILALAYIHKIIASEQYSSGKEAILEVDAQVASNIKISPHIIFDLLPFTNKKQQVKKSPHKLPIEITI